MTEESVLRPEEIEGVLSGGGGNGDAASAAQDDGPQPYSLRDPVSITPERQALAKARLEEVVGVLNQVFQAESGGAINVTLDSLQQQTATAALSVLPPPVWVASLGASGGGGLSLALQSSIGIALVDSTLGGGCEVPETGREPTPLEARVVSRFIATAADSIGRVLKRGLAPVEFKTGSVPATVAAPGEPVALGQLRFTLGEKDHVSQLLATTSLLFPPLEAAQATDAPGPLAGKLTRVAVGTRPVLRAGRVCVGDLRALRPRKVLRLDAPADEAFELRVAGLTIAKGPIVRDPERTVFSVVQKAGHPEAEGSEEP